MRRFVIGDIHGCAKALDTLIDSIAPTKADEIVFLGDYVDRGPNSRDVINQVIELGKSCRTVTLRGNHEIMLQGVALYGMDDQVWLSNGGNSTVASYGGNVSRIPEHHLDFFRSLRPYYEIEEAIFVHAGYVPELEMRLQDETALYWMHLTDPFPGPHCSGKRVFVGHTPQPGGTVLDIGHLVGIDTYCFGGGFLTAMELASEDIIQVNRQGHVRKTPLKKLYDGTRWVAKAAGGFCKKWQTPAEPEVSKTAEQSDAG